MTGKAGTYHLEGVVGVCLQVLPTQRVAVHGRSRKGWKVQLCGDGRGDNAVSAKRDRHRLLLMGSRYLFSDLLKGYRQIQGLAILRQWKSPYVSKHQANIVALRWPLGSRYLPMTDTCVDHTINIC